jgi:hypothetical protein
LIPVIHTSEFYLRINTPASWLITLKFINSVNGVIEKQMTIFIEGIQEIENNFHCGGDTPDRSEQ